MVILLLNSIMNNTGLWNNFFHQIQFLFSVKQSREFIPNHWATLRIPKMQVAQSDAHEFEGGGGNNHKIGYKCNEVNFFC